MTHPRKKVKVDELNESVKETGRLIHNDSISASSNMRRRKANSGVNASKYSTITATGSLATQSSGFNLHLGCVFVIGELLPSCTLQIPYPSLMGPKNELANFVCPAQRRFFFILNANYIFWHYIAGFLDEIREICLTSWHMKWKLFISFSPFFMVLVAFVAFVRWNGSVVLGTTRISCSIWWVRNLFLTLFLNVSGAKEAHVVSPHFAQLMYFSLVSALATAPVHFSLSNVANLFESFWKSRLSFFQWLLALTAGFLSVHFFRSVQTSVFCRILSVSESHIS